MIKKILILVVFAVSVGSIPTFAATSERVLEDVAVLNVADSTDNEVAMLQVTDLSFDQSESVASQSKPQPAEIDESALSMEWLFVIALFWFVILSNRRGV